jgi:prepilin signal peptidase PulO-like enzyme (type II secretory pathway)
VVFSVVLIALIAVRRITLHSLIPFGPVLILGGLTALALGGTL